MSATTPRTVVTHPAVPTPPVLSSPLVAGGPGPAATVRGLCQDLERYLGDPFALDSRITYRRVLELDEKECYPHEELAALHAWGVHEYAVPARWGGRAENVETSMHLLRQVARRDPTAAAALGLSSLSYMSIWVAGTDEQRRYYGEQIRNGAKICWGLSERDFGSDILASGTVARPVPGGYRVNGEKWLIGNATLADLLVLFVRTGARPGPAAFSLLVLDKRTVPAASVESLPHEPLHGLRGLDLSGVRLHDVFVPSSALVGPEGHGLEIALQSGYAIRSVITSIALGCTDTALRLALDFATTRRVFGSRVADIPYSRRQLTNAYADMLVGDAVATVATRSLQVCPEQSSVFSSVAKFWVPTLLPSSPSCSAPGTT
jgi:alkylation response protein AidB-like acyl-CoA dehydrogenase